MKTIVAGSRWILGVPALFYVMTCIRELPWKPTEIVSGRARGVDQMGESWAKIHRVPLKPFPAAWYDADGVLDRRAGFKRNTEMADYAEALLAVWDGESRGTAHMIEQATKRGLLVAVRSWVGDGLDC